MYIYLDKYCNTQYLKNTYNNNNNKKTFYTLLGQHIRPTGTGTFRTITIDILSF